MRRSTWFRPTHPASKQLAYDEEVRQLAIEVFDAMPYELRSEVEVFVRGVYPGRQQPLERYTTELQQAYAPLRRLIQRKYGPRILLYRGEPVELPAAHREFLSWSPSQRLAALFAERRRFSIIEAFVLVDDVVAVLISATNQAYVEYLVLDRPEYHVERATLPMRGVVYFDTDSEAEVASLTRALRRELWVVGGRVLHVKVNHEDRYASATVLLPAEVVGDDDRMTFGDFEVEGLSPYSRVVRSS
jgi:hypothetical protein